ncbi:MAG: SpoIIE family protein phosphatase [Ignavibacteriae bacterium]|nr:SpoIIE family protein phosphatase [Ignavibacteriota bacterium]
MTLNRRLLFLLSGVTFAADFVYMIARQALVRSSAGGDLFHGLLLLAGAGTFAVAWTRRQRDGEPNPVQMIGSTVITATVLLVTLGLFRIGSMISFENMDGRLVPDGITSVIVTLIMGIASGIASILLLFTFTELIFIKRRRNTRRNYLVMLGFFAAYALVFSILSIRQEEGGATYIFVSFGLVLMMVVNSFRFSWILVLTRREKLANLGLSFFGFVFFIILAVDASVFDLSAADSDVYKSALAYFHPVMDAFFSTTMLFGAIYMGLGFASTLMHLPTAKEFDRKKAEISSFQNMSRLVTEVFDLDDLLSTSTQLALDITEGGSAWIELFPAEVYRDTPERPADREAALERTPLPTTVSLRNMSEEQRNALRLSDGRPLHALVLETGKGVTIHDLQRDRRIDHTGAAVPAGTLALLPLHAYGGIVGLLAIHKKTAYEFDKDLLQGASAFADLVSVALENSRLIAESLSRERFKQELLLARQMQRSLLPSLLPIAETYDVYAESIPAFEVGGDYYDMVALDERQLGITIGDVSGKGVSAALYMAQVKGIFQSMSGDMTSTRALLRRMNDTLCRTMDRKSFISLLYAVLDIQSGSVRFSRAGHCPLLYISGGSSRYLRPNGMGLGLDPTERFADSIEEEGLVLAPGDVIVLFTDGVTEARDKNGEEFHFERLADIAEKHAGESARSIGEAIIDAVRRFTGNGEALDDLTLLVLRWNGTTTRHETMTDERYYSASGGSAV